MADHLPAEIGAVKYKAGAGETPDTAVGNLFSISLPEYKNDEIDTTPLGAVPKTSRPSLQPEYGEMVLKGYYDDLDTSHAFLRNAFIAKSIDSYAICYDGTFANETFNGFVKSWKRDDLTKGENIKFECVIKVVGAVTVAVDD